MGLPTKKLTKSSARRRAAHFALKPTSTTKCKNCNAIILPHRACNKCGFYKGEKKIASKNGGKKK